MCLFSNPCIQVPRCHWKVKSGERTQRLNMKIIMSYWNAGMGYANIKPSWSRSCTFTYTQKICTNATFSLLNFSFLLKIVFSSISTPGSLPQYRSETSPWGEVAWGATTKWLVLRRNLPHQMTFSYRIGNWQNCNPSKRWSISYMNLIETSLEIYLKTRRKWSRNFQTPKFVALKFIEEPQLFKPGTWGKVRSCRLHLKQVFTTESDIYLTSA